MVNAGYNIRQMAQAWLVLDLTNSSLKAGLVNAMPSIAVFTSLYGGAVLDRGDRRSVLIWARVALTALILISAVLVSTRVIEWWHLIIVGLGLSLAFTFHDPANQSFAMDVVGRDRLMNAVSLSTIIANVAGIAAPAVGGALIALGISWAFWLLVGIYAVSFLSVLPVRVKTAHVVPTRSIIADMREGLKYAGRSPTIRWLLALSSCFMFMGVSAAIVPIFAKNVFDVGAVGYGYMATSQGAGSFAGAVLLTFAGEARRPGLLIFGNLIVSGAALVLLAVAPWYWLVFPALFVLGMTQAITFITLPTSLQRQSAPEMRGRIMGLFFMVVTLLQLGWLIGGALNTVIGTRQTAMAAAAGTFALTLVVFGRSKTLRQLV